MPDENEHNPIEADLKRRSFVENVLPFLTSLTLHLALLGLGILMYQSVKQMVSQYQSQKTVADVEFTPGITVSAERYRGDANLPDQKPIQDLIDDPKANGWNTEQGRDTKSLSKSLAPGSNSGDAEQGMAAGMVGGHAGLRSGVDGDGGPLAAFGLTPQRGGSPNIFGNRETQTARSIVFLCDSSGSMLNKFAGLRRELSKAVQNLRPIQSFGITFFGDNRCANLASQLVMATPQTKFKASDFLEQVVPRGTSDPLPGIELAFAQKPQLIILLTDGDFPDNDAVLNRIRQLNRDHRVRVNTIAFVGEGDSDTAFMSLLKQVAQENGGVYRHVNQDELQ